LAAKKSHLVTKLNGGMKVIAHAFSPGYKT
jgi:hypothetical protein